MEGNHTVLLKPTLGKLTGVNSEDSSGSQSGALTVRNLLPVPTPTLTLHPSSFGKGTLKHQPLLSKGEGAGGEG